MPVVVVLATTAAFAILATRGLPPTADLARLLLAMLGGQVAIGALNEVVDAPLDTVARPDKPIPSGEIAPRTALKIMAGGLCVMVIFSAGFGPRSLLFCTIGTACGLAYDLWLKRTAFSWLPYLIALPLLPLWVWTALGRFDPRLLVLYPLGAPAVLAVHLGQALPDTVSDRAFGVRHLASTLGERRTLITCWLATLTAAMLAAGAAPMLAERVSIVFISSGLGATLVALNVALYAIRRRLGVMSCFPCVATATAIMGLGWVLAIIV